MSRYDSRKPKNYIEGTQSYLHRQAENDSYKIQGKEQFLIDYFYFTDKKKQMNKRKRKNKKRKIKVDNLVTMLL